MRARKQMQIARSDLHNQLNLLGFRVKTFHVKRPFLCHSERSEERHKK
jgi:hypothetical protein